MNRNYLQFYIKIYTPLNKEIYYFKESLEVNTSLVWKSFVTFKRFFMRHFKKDFSYENISKKINQNEKCLFQNTKNIKCAKNR